MTHTQHAVGEKVQLPGGITSIDHTFSVPLRWSEPSDGHSITVFARELFLGREADTSNKPCILFLQGGPGFPSPRTMGTGGWVGRALKDFRVVLLDQRLVAGVQSCWCMIAALQYVRAPACAACTAERCCASL